MSEQIRSFIAVPIPEELRETLNSISIQFRNRIKDRRTKVGWVKPEAIHITLKFLDTIDAELTEPILKGMGEAMRGVPSFVASLRGIGVFPNMNKPRIIWAGVEKGEKDLCALQKRIEECLLKFGFDKEKREFSPHITLGRIKSLGGRGEILRSIRDLQGPVIGTFLVGQVLLMKSQLTPQGANYEALGTVGLK